MIKFTSESRNNMSKSENITVSYWYYGCLLLASALLSCNDDMKKMDKVLEKAGNNKAELISVLDHYQSQDDTLKYKAAVFLIENMEFKMSYTQQSMKQYDIAYDLLDKIYKSDFLKEKEAIQRSNEIVDFINTTNIQLELVADCQIITADFLIDNIDKAVEVWQKYPWSRENVDFDEFCESILPYKVGREPFDYWRQETINSFSWIPDSLLTSTNLTQVTRAISKALKDSMTFNPSFRMLPADVSFHNLKKSRNGSCRLTTILNIYYLRSIGIPARYDYVDSYGNDAVTGHSWISFQDENDQLFAFDSGLEIPNFDWVDFTVVPSSRSTGRKAAKVFRICYGCSEETTLKSDNSNNNFTDVTGQYNPKPRDILLNLENVKNTQQVSLCTFGLENLKYSSRVNRVQGTEYLFSNMGTDILYVPTSSTTFGYEAIANPIILDSQGTTRSLNPNYQIRETIAVDRKFPVRKLLENRANQVIGYAIQGSNDLNKNDWENLYVIEEMPSIKSNTYKIENSGYYRYFRVISPNTRCEIAELSFQGVLQNMKNGESLGLQGEWISNGYIESNGGNNLVDNNPLSYFKSTELKNGWIGLKLKEGERARLTRVDLYPPNDGNSIEIGNEYELLYFDMSWKSLGKQVSEKQYLEYQDCPSNCLYLLRNLSKGKQIRVFTFEDGKQVFW